MSDEEETNILPWTDVTGWVEATGSTAQQPDLTTNLIPGHWFTNISASQPWGVSQPASQMSMLATLTPESLHQIRQVVRAEIQDALDRENQQGLERMQAAIEAVPDPETEMASILMELSDDKFEALIQRVRESKA